MKTITKKEIKDLLFGKAHFPGKIIKLEGEGSTSIFPIESICKIINESNGGEVEIAYPDSDSIHMRMFNVALAGATDFYYGDTHYKIVD